MSGRERESEGKRKREREREGGADVLRDVLNDSYLVTLKVEAVCVCVCVCVCVFQGVYGEMQSCLGI